MKVDVITETVNERIQLPESHPLTVVPLKHVSDSVLKEVATEIYIAENPDVRSLFIVKVGIQRPVDRFGTFIQFIGQVQRDVLRWDLSDYGPVPLERRPWYVRPRRKLLEKHK